MQEAKGPNKVLIGVIVAVLLAVIAGYVFYSTRQDNALNQSETVTKEDDTSLATADDQAENSEDEYKDGTYTASGEYMSPGGSEEIEVTVKLVDGKVVETSATAQAASGTSRQYQSEFINNYEDLVVGKNINDIELDRVAGSSLTSGGFNDALETIRQEAAA